MAKRGRPNPTVPPSGCVVILATLALLVAPVLVFASPEEDVAKKITDLLAAERLEEARALADDAAARQPEDAGLQMLAGVIALRSRDESTAASRFEAAARIDPDLPGLDFQRGTLEVQRCSREKAERKKKRCHDRAADYFQAEAGRQPEEPKVVAALARALIAAGREQSAATALNEWMRLDPGDPEPVVLLARKYTVDGRWDDLATLPNALRAAPPEVESLVCGEIAALFYVAGRHDAGLPLVTRALEVERDPVRRAGLSAMRAAAESRPDDALGHFVEFAVRSSDSEDELTILRAAAEVLLTIPPQGFRNQQQCAVVRPGGECEVFDENLADVTFPVKQETRTPLVMHEPQILRAGRATIGVLVTREGRPIPYRVLEGNDSAVVRKAIWMIRQSRYEPGRFRGEKVPFFSFIKIKTESGR